MNICIYSWLLVCLLVVECFVVCVCLFVCVCVVCVRLFGGLCRYVYVRTVRLFV